MPAFIIIVFRNISQFEFYECKFCTNANMEDYFRTSFLFRTCPHLVTKWSLRDMKIDQIFHSDISVEVLQPKMDNRIKMGTGNISSVYIKLEYFLDQNCEQERKKA